MSKAADYRGLARKFRREADEAILPEEREVCLRAAERWDILAEESEQSEGVLKNPAPKWVSSHRIGEVGRAARVAGGGAPVLA